MTPGLGSQGSLSPGRGLGPFYGGCLGLRRLWLLIVAEGI